MLKVLKILISVALIHTLLACASEDSFSFFNPVRTSNYQLESYFGKTDFSLSEKYDLDQTLINQVSFESFNGKSSANISAIYIGDIDQIDTKKIIVFCHDKNGNIDTNWPRIKLLGNLGIEDYGVLAIDYRGYGTSEGSPSEEGIYADVDYALRWLQDKSVLEENIIIYGYGLGASAAIKLAAEPRSLTPAKIIIEAPFASIESLIQNDLLQNIPSSYLTDLKFNNVDKISKVSQPLLWLHGTADEVYDLKSQGQLVFNKHRGISGTDKFAYKVSGAAHTNIPQVFLNGFDGYLNALRSFLELE